MPKIVGYDDVTETSQFKYATEASDLGLRAGDWPARLPTTMGNKLDFVRGAAHFESGELKHIKYRQLCGCIDLTVFND